MVYETSGVHSKKTTLSTQRQARPAVCYENRAVMQLFFDFNDPGVILDYMRRRE